MEERSYIMRRVPGQDIENIIGQIIDGFRVEAVRIKDGPDTVANALQFDPVYGGALPVRAS